MSYTRGAITIAWSVALVAVFAVIIQLFADFYDWMPIQMSAPITAGFAIVVWFVVYDYLGDAP